MLKVLEITYVYIYIFCVVVSSEILHTTHIDVLCDTDNNDALKINHLQNWIVNSTIDTLKTILIDLNDISTYLGVFYA